LRVPHEDDVVDGILVPERVKRGDDAGVERVDVARPLRPRTAARPVALRRDERPLLGGVPLERLRVAESVPAHAVKEHHARSSLRPAAHDERRRRVVRVERLHADRTFVRSETEDPQREKKRDRSDDAHRLTPIARGATWSRS
jgi:hypothetical protein